MAFEFEDLPYRRTEEHAYFLRILGVSDRLVKDVIKVLDELGNDHRYPIPPHLLPLLPAELIPRSISNIADVDISDYHKLTHLLLQIRVEHGDTAAKIARFAVAGLLRRQNHGGNDRNRRRRQPVRSVITNRAIKKLVRGRRSEDKKSRICYDDDNE